jgi:hypothetical protein
MQNAAFRLLGTARKVVLVYVSYDGFWTGREDGTAI